MEVFPTFPESHFPVAPTTESVFAWLAGPLDTLPSSSDSRPPGDCEIRTTQHPCLSESLSVARLAARFCLGYPTPAFRPERNADDRTPVVARRAPVVAGRL